MADPEKLKGYVAFVREMIIVLVLGLLLTFPGWINERLAQAGFVKASVAGLEWEAFNETAERTEAATENTARLETRLDELGTQLSEISRSETVNPDVRRRLTALSQDVEQTKSDTTEIRRSLQNSLVQQRSVIERVQPRVSTPLTRPSR